MDSVDADAMAVAPARAGADEAVEYTLSNGMAARLASLDVSIAFSSYQSGILYFLGRGREGAHLHQSVLPKPMGISVDGPGRLTLASGAQVVRFENVLAPHERINDCFDACYVPRTFHLTGDLDLHDIGVDRDDRPIFVNTRFNCLATLSPRHSFAPVWKPPFVSGLLDGDKCHLNGLAMRRGKPAYVTAASRSDVIDGWRDRRADGGVLIDVEADDDRLRGPVDAAFAADPSRRIVAPEFGDGRTRRGRGPERGRRPVCAPRLLPRLSPRPRLPRQIRFRRPVEAALQNASRGWRSTEG